MLDTGTYNEHTREQTWKTIIFLLFIVLLVYNFFSCPLMCRAFAHAAHWFCNITLSYRCLFPSLSEFWFHYILILIGLNILIRIDFRFHSGQNDSTLLDFILSPWVGGSVVFVCPLSVLRIWIVCCVRPRCISGVKNHLSFFRVFYFQYRHKSKQIDAILRVSRIG